MEIILYYGLLNGNIPSPKVENFVLQGKFLIREGIVTVQDGALALMSTNDLSIAYPKDEILLLLVDRESNINTIAQINTNETIAGQKALMQQARDTHHFPASEQARGILIRNKVLAYAKDFWESFVPK